MPTLQLVIDSSGAVIGAKAFSAAGKQVELSAVKAGVATSGLDARFASVGKTSIGLKSILGIGGLLGAFTAFRAVSSITGIVGGFETQLTTLGGITGATAAEMDLFTDKARELGAETAFSASQAAEGLINLSRAGFAVNESLSAIDAVLNLATAQTLDLGESAEIVASAIRGFRLEASQAADVANVLSNQANRSATDVTLLSNALSFTAATASLSGSDLAEASAAIGVLSDNAIRGTRAGTNLNQIFLKLAKPTSEASRLFRNLAIDLDDVNPEKVGLVPALQRLEPVLQSNAAAATIFGARNAAAARILAGSTDRIREITEENRNLGDVVGELAEKQLATLEGRFKILRSTSEEAALAIGEAGFGGALKGIVDTTTEAVRGFAQIVKFTSDLGVTTKDVTGATLGLGAALVAVGVASPFGGILAAVSALSLAIQGLNKLSRETEEAYKIQEEGGLSAYGKIGDEILRTQKRIKGLQELLAKSPDNDLAVTKLAELEQKLVDLQKESSDFATKARESGDAASKQASDVDNADAASGAFKLTLEELESALKRTQKEYEGTGEEVGNLTREQKALRSELESLLPLLQGGVLGAGQFFAAAGAVEVFNDKLAESVDIEMRLGELAMRGQRDRATQSQRAFESLDMELQALEAQRQEYILGTEEFRKRAEVQGLINLAQEAGIEVNDELRGQYRATLDELDRLAETRDRWEQVGTVIGEGVGGALKELVKEGEITRDSLESIFQSIIDQLFQVLVQQQIVSAFSGGFGNFGANQVGASGMILGGQGTVQPMASGAILMGRTNIPLSGGRNGVGGEAGPEGVLPLERVGGKLGVNAAGMGGGTSVTIVQNISTPDPDAFRQSQRQTAAGARRALSNVMR